ncbi:cytochrome c oxidase subunit II [Filibacter tadaridae]|uniref:Cytochrome c oxidase subunit 2 n=1 Tax=Filibacter tadaridae TaxID=2483811 RepID=A0A3P5WUU1_9BACL|nr:cytochrome c oxidase subunit II [Filibacter tadaridae]VDC25112.1 Quinol oxidase subunit 2 precursor [Filibacter tadaridae]
MKKLGIFPLLFLLAGCTNSTVLNPKSTTGKEQAFLIWFGLGIMLFVLVIVFFLLARVVINYREKKNGLEEYRPKFISPKKQRKLELIWTIGPIVLLIILAIPTVSTGLKQSPVAEAESTMDGVHIDVTAKQFEWTFIYETDKEKHNILLLPEGEPIILHLSSMDVIHSFWVPELAGKVDLVPGKPIVYRIENPEIGVYKGKCAEYCGVQHANMTFTVKVVAKEEFEEYIAK